MTAPDVAKLKRLLDAYHEALKPEHGRNAMATARRHLETALVRHAEDLIRMAAIQSKVPPMPEPLGPIEVISDDGHRQWVNPRTGELWRGS